MDFQKLFFVGSVGADRQPDRAQARWVGKHSAEGWLLGRAFAVTLGAGAHFDIAPSARALSPLRSLVRPFRTPKWWVHAVDNGMLNHGPLDLGAIFHTGSTRRQIVSNFYV
jgi:hypothetical protein